MQSRKASHLFFVLFGCIASFYAFAANKVYVSPQELLESSFALSKKVYDSGFRPTFLIALWRGGSPIGIAVTEFFSYKGAAIAKHCAVRTSAYDYDQLKKIVDIFGLECIAAKISVYDKILVVDDLIDSGKTMKAFVETLKEISGENFPGDQNVKVATIYHKPKNACFVPDYFLYQTSAWLVFPHEVEVLSIDEIAQFQGEVVAGIVS